MLPLYGSFPHQQQQHQQNSTPSQTQPQPGMNNPRMPMPFIANNYINGPNIPILPNQPGFMTGPNNPNLGIPQLGPQHGKAHTGFGPAAFPASGPAFGHNTASKPPQFNQNMNHLGQFCLNQFGQFNQMQMPMPMPMQIPGLSQFVPGNAYQPAQNPGFLANPQFGNFPYNPVPPRLNQNHPRNLPVPAVDTNTMNSSSSAATVPGPVQSEEGNKNFARNPNRPEGFNSLRGNWKNPANKNFTNNSRRGPQQGRFQNSQFNQKKNGWKNFGSPNVQNGRGKSNENPVNSGFSNSMSQGREQKQRRSLTYSEHEVKQWREERRNNYPSKENIQKKLNKKMLDQECIQKEAQIRRERLKEILTKQAELGVEVAEIPGCYLSDPRKRGHEIGESERPFNKKRRFRNKFDKRGRYDKQDRYSKKQRLNEGSSSNVPPANAKKPTLLQKLLSADIKRDKSHLLQAFRFMVMNSFFNDSADSPLKFSSVVKDGSGENGTAEEICSNVGKDVSEISGKTFVGKVDNSDDDGDSDDDDNDNHRDESGSDTQEGNQEEGEIH